MKLVEQLKEELTDLTYKINRLSTFFETDTYSELEIMHKHLLSKQYIHMKDYASTLSDRIKLLGD